MRLIDADNIQRVRLEDSCYVIEHSKGDEIDCIIDASTVPAIPMERIEQLRQEMTDSSFSHYMELGEYIGENTKRWDLIKLPRVLELIDNMIKEYSDGGSN